MSKVKLNAAIPEQLPMPTDSCRPFIVTRSGVTYVVVLSPKSVIFFDTSDGDITYSESDGYLANNFKFVRFLATGESFTYTK